MTNALKLFLIIFICAKSGNPQSSPKTRPAPSNRRASNWLIKKANGSCTALMHGCLAGYIDCGCLSETSFPLYETQETSRRGNN